MADGVRFIMDKLAILFRRLEDTQVFSGEEVRAIVKKVTDCEYVLKRRQQETADYQSYLQYLLKLDMLLAARVRRMEAKGKGKDGKEGKGALDNHTTYVFDRAVRRFGGEQSLWADYVAFLQAKENTTQLNTVLGRALSLHPRVEVFWVQAAVHELESMGNAHAARVTLQRALRVNKRSALLWTRYFELELWSALRVV
ncbi:hypothetical protein B484DRAFT_304174, partial [Ochromonadaceae sp. CCMP2298]